jgi:hypothetical protein
VAIETPFTKIVWEFSIGAYNFTTRGGRPLDGVNQADLSLVAPDESAELLVFLEAQRILGGIFGVHFRLGAQRKIAVLYVPLGAVLLETHQ